MSLAFRPVREEWGAHTDCFVSHDALIAILAGIAVDLEINQEENNYGVDTTVLWIEKGMDFLRFLASDAFTVAKARHELKEMLPCAEEESDADLEALVQNIKMLTTSWCLQIDSAGHLRFYVDNY